MHVDLANVRVLFIHDGSHVRDRLDRRVIAPKRFTIGGAPPIRTDDVVPILARRARGAGAQDAKVGNTAALEWPFDHDPHRRLVVADRRRRLTEAPDDVHMRQGRVSRADSRTAKAA